MFKIIKKILIFAGIVLVLAGGAAYGMGCWFFQEHFLPGIEVAGFNVSFMTAAETEKVLNEEIRSYALAIDTRNGGREKLTADQVGMEYQSTGEVKNLIKNQPYLKWLLPHKNSYTLTKGFDLDHDKFEQAVNSLKCANNMQAPVNARILKVDGKYQVIPEINGTQLDMNQARSLIETALKRGDESVSLEACYKNPTVRADDASLARACEQLNRMLQTIITYDFGDRSEFIDGSIAESWVKDYVLDKEEVHAYVEGLAKKYDTYGMERKFVTYNDREIMLAGGEYGWKIDVEKETEELYKLVTNGAVTVRTPEYSHTALKRERNDVGYDYLEIDTAASKIVLYVKGEPVVEDSILYSSKLPAGINVLLSKKESVDEPRYQLSVSQDISILSASPEKEALFKIGRSDPPLARIQTPLCILSESCAKEILAAVRDNCPVIVY